MRRTIGAHLEFSEEFSEAFSEAPRLKLVTLLEVHSRFEGKVLGISANYMVSAQCSAKRVKELYPPTPKPDLERQESAIR